jgi:hypothetical protein
MEVETEAAFDAAALETQPGVRSVRQTAPRQFYVAVDDAGEGTPPVMAAIEAAGGVVVAVREYRPSFDEVFAALVSRHRATLPPSEDGEAGEQSR